LDDDLLVENLVEKITQRRRTREREREILKEGEQELREKHDEWRKWSQTRE
jgi:hypothetical protein